MRNYSELREYLIEMGFKCVDMNPNGDEIFVTNEGFLFSIREE